MTKAEGVKTKTRKLKVLKLKSLNLKARRDDLILI